MSAVKSDPQMMHERLSAALRGPIADLRVLWEEEAAARQQVVADLLESGQREGRAALLLLFSLAAWRISALAEARTYAIACWQLVDGRVPKASQALVLTQLAAALAASNELRPALRAARRAEALLAADEGDTLPQMLAVRAQLLALCRRAGVESSDLQQRRDRTLGALEREGRVPGGLAGVRHLLRVFVSGEEPPHWALVHHLRWANVFPR